MIVCPLCQNPQAAGFECDVCGKDLTSFAGLEGLPPPPVAVEPLPGLESTPERVGEVAVERVAALEEHAFADVGDVALEALQGVESARFAAVGDVPVQPLDELAQDRAPDDGVRTSPLGEVVACIVCKDVMAAPGTLCEVCGNRLPRALEKREPELTVEDWVRCRSCGAPGPKGHRCNECGQMTASTET